ncbi:GTP cyclohydrolase I FolE [Vagococcus elongatus]|uniref:GTP cyclohydrolase 1 n=2 Tax=Vagococcus elongatus TaxID=180344 RepID=A0A430AZS7_9ENTE|nr:GTP cyclohydrolase I FolE [Vagococcus elongatus]
MMDEKKIKTAVKMLLEGMGEDIQRPGLLETPERVAKSYKEIFGGLYEDAAVHLTKTFPVESNEFVLEKDIPFYSTCEHHLIPFFGVAHVAYVPTDKVVGLSKLARTVDIFARRPQIQEQLTNQIADAITEHLEPAGVMVIIEAEHLCMSMRGVKKPGAKTLTMVSRGVLQTDSELKNTILSMVGIK